MSGLMLQMSQELDMGTMCNFPLYVTHIPPLQISAQAVQILQQGNRSTFMTLQVIARLHGTGRS
jgi:hypothetical protein